ncbi:Cdc6/Cdc18 family protein [Natronosalvus rutilus]|uniref:ORC1-type DNA replication protein n=1 Tax=Natronosalvus rutilus TaxID=2953753 RepID=A0A9E7SVT4_9EURY|nr:AAA family ATPase [Natronosalvus rutilus]UTF54790.1 AAA family ATPase [Natronosalvus rutilus]
MSKYDDLFDDTAPTESVFADKGALDPLADPAEIVAREAQERELATILNGVHEGYLPPTVSIYGPPGTGKTLTARRVTQEFAARHDQVAVEYVNLKECRTIFSAANEICVALTGEKKKAYVGLDGVFEAIWEALEAYPAWTVVILDEIDQLQHDTNYDPNDFFYRLLRGEGKLKREINLSLWLLSNQLMEVDLRLDSRVESAMSDEAVFFPPYEKTALQAVLEPRLKQAFREGALPEAVRTYGIANAAMRWGDARKALTLFRQAGETANEQALETVTGECIDVNLEHVEKAMIVEQLSRLPLQHILVLRAITSWIEDATGEISQPVTTAQIKQGYDQFEIPSAARIGDRAIRDVLTDLETMGLIETWIESKGREGRVKQIQTTFDPTWVAEANAARNVHNTPDAE